MITNFEEITKPLTALERKLLPLVLAVLSDHTVNNPIQSLHLIQEVNTLYFVQSGDVKKKVYLSAPGLRKIINAIRRGAYAPVIGTSDGYFLSFDKIKLASQIKSLEEIASAIQAAADGMKQLLEKEV